MDLFLKDKVIVVTGGSAGIGKGICLALAQEGAIPFIIGRTKEKVDASVKEIEEMGGRAGKAYAELTNANECEMAIQVVLKQFGQIDGLVNNAGVNDSVGLEHGTVDAFVQSLHKNLTHYYTVAKLVLPELKKNKGAIVNIGSKTSITGQGGTSGYAAANGGRNALTREWAVELLPYSIRVNAIIVAECYTPLYDKWIKTFEHPEEKLSEITKNIPLENRMTTEQEIANAALFLLSSRSGHTTGQLIYVDGGYTHLDRSL